jgi:DNA-binding response OmpR family regulator
MAACPCCGKKMNDTPLNQMQALPLTGKQRLLCGFLAGKIGKWQTRAKVIDAIYGDDPDGGPDGPEMCLRVFVHKARKQLTSIGLDIEVARGRGADGMRMILVPEEEMKEAA